jgi:hypothetical protein
MVSNKNEIYPEKGNRLGPHIPHLSEMGLHFLKMYQHLGNEA